jgi:competence protein ComEC
MRLAETLPVALEGEDLTLTGTISSMPQRSERGWRFDFEVETPEQIPHHISLAWYDMGFRDGADLRVPPLHAGDRWQLTARLRRPHGNLNPHGFDYEAMLFERGIRATGYVRPKGEHQLISTGSRAYFIERSREAVRTKFEQTLAQLQDGAPYVGVLIALAVGDQQVVPRSQWDLFARTGITHLVSILWLLKRKYRTMTATLFRQTVPSCPRLTLTSAFQAPGSNEAIP